jgi:hypothetical protein
MVEPVTEEWISLREFARRRDVSLAAVQKAIGDGRVRSVRRGDAGRLEAVAYHAGMREWNESTDPAQASRTGAGIVVPAATEGAAAGSSDLAPQSDEKREVDQAGAAASSALDKDFGYYESRARSEHFKAKQAELEFLRSIGLLVSVDEERQVKSRRYRAIRDQLLGIPDRICTIIAAERDPARVHVLLTQEIKRVLNELSDDAAAEAAGGAAERVEA